MEYMELQEESLYWIDPALIRQSPNQPRKQFGEEELVNLKNSIARYGILQPLTVMKTPGGYELLAGERRLRAAILAGLTKVPCRFAEVDEERGAEITIIENLQRKDLTPFEEAEALGKLLKTYGMTQEALGEKLAVSQSYIANKLRLLTLEPPVRDCLTEAGLSERHARCLLRIKGEEKRLACLKYIIEKEYTVRETEAYIEKCLREEKAPPPPKRHVRGAIKDLRLFYNSLDRALGIMKGAGMRTKLKKKETEEGVEVTILISRTLA